jgi:3-oxoacyl-[acyl-carrier-protein] synthase-1
MRRAVITGIGVVSCLGNDKEAVLDSLREGRSGIRFNPSYRDMGLRSQVSGSIDIDQKALVDRKTLRFMGDTAAYAHIAMDQAIQDAGLGPEEVSHPRSGLITGSGGGCPSEVVNGAEILQTKGVRKIGPYLVTRTMCSTVAACLATPFKIKGVNYATSSACATSAHCIGNALEQIQLDKQDIVFAGGAEEEHWTLAMMFDAMGALSSHYNETPEKASRPYDVNRDGFVISGGAGIVVVEERERALDRGAHIYAEVAGYGATSDGDNMVAPSGEGAKRCMQLAMATVDAPVDYINAHGTATPAGDMMELRAMKETFGDRMPRVTSTKSLSGHSLGAAGVHEAIYSLLMMEHNFIAASINIDELDSEAEGMPVIRERVDNAGIKTAMSNSFGFGGTNACLVFARPA